MAVKVFISYKHQNKSRNDWVDKLYSDLRAAGIDAKLDNYEVAPGESFSDYMTQGIGTCDHVLFIVTPKAVEAVEAGEGALAFEMQISNARRIAEDSDFTIIPILREGDKTSTYLSDHRYIDFRHDDNYENKFNLLLKWFNQKIVAPQLGGPLIETLQSEKHESGQPGTNGQQSNITYQEDAKQSELNLLDQEVKNLDGKKRYKIRIPRGFLWTIIGGVIVVIIGLLIEYKIFMPDSGIAPSITSSAIDLGIDPTASPETRKIPITEIYNSENLCEHFRMEWGEGEFSSNKDYERSQFSSTVELFESAGHTILGVGSNNGYSAIYDIDSGEYQSLEEKSENRIIDILYEPNSNRLFIGTKLPEIVKYKIQGSFDARLEIIFEDFPTGTRLQALNRANPYIIAATEKGKLLFLFTSSISVEDTIENAHVGIIWDIDVSPSEKYMISGGSDGIGYLWALNNGLIQTRSAEESFYPVDGDVAVTAVSITELNDEYLVALGTHKGSLTIHSANSMERNRSQDIVLSSPIWSLDFSNDGRLIAIGTEFGDVYIFETEAILNFYNGGGGLPIEPLPLVEPFPDTETFYKISSIQFSDDDYYLAIGYTQGATVLATCP